MYRAKNDYQGHADFPKRIYLAGQMTNAIASADYGETW